MSQARDLSRDVAPSSGSNPDLHCGAGPQEAMVCKASSVWNPLSRRGGWDPPPFCSVVMDSWRHRRSLEDLWAAMSWGHSTRNPPRKWRAKAQDNSAPGFCRGEKGRRQVRPRRRPPQRVHPLVVSASAVTSSGRRPCPGRAGQIVQCASAHNRLVFFPSVAPGRRPSNRLATKRKGFP
jgi:hypothetical protein